ncbi:hypothetical protein J3R83DRAFT_9076 [Lanmaoa asiatica]|nr:hypothetical protein J3R83DRAFT_9076 [Lanmaoa asiatica]
MEAKKLRDAEDSLPGSADAGNAENSAHGDAPVDIILTRSEALRTARGLQKYVEGVDTAFASNLTKMLRAFGRETRALEMKETKITSYFTRN